MDTRAVLLRGVSYELGEERRAFSEAPGYREVVERERIPDLPDLWGWGHYHATKRPYVLGQLAARRALDAAGVSPRDVDLTVLSCSYFPDADERLYRATAGILHELGLDRSLVEGNSLGGCATLLTTVQRACQLVAAGVHECVLVIGVDCLPSNELRFWNYGLFSDAAVALLVVGDAGAAGYRVLGAARGIDLAEMREGVRFDAGGSLHLEVLGELWSKTGCSPEAVERVFNNNVFLPIKTQKDKLAGFTKRQMFVDNVAGTGHCLSCDSLVNLCDRATAKGPSPGDRFVLQADGNGFCAALLVEWSGAHPVREVP